MVTDDAGTLGRGARQLELGGELSRDLEGPTGARTSDHSGEGTVSVGLGLGDDLDLVVGFASVWSRTQEEGGPPSDRSGLADATVELKWRAFEANGFALAVKPGISLPTGDARRGMGTGRICWGLTLIASEELGRFGLHANAGYERDDYARSVDRQSSRAHRLQVSAAATARIAPPLQLVLDVGAETNADRASSTWPAYGLGGLVFLARESMDLDVGVKVGLTAPETDLAGLIGLTWRF